MITTASRHAKVAVIEFLTVHLGLLSREQLLLEEKKRHGYCCLVGSLCNWSGCFCNVGALYGPCPKVVSGDMSWFEKSGVGEEDTATLRVGISPML